MTHNDFNPQWLANIPELETRPLLCERISWDRKVRHRLFQAANELEIIATIPEPKVAAQCLALRWRQMRLDLDKFWRARLLEETGSNHLYAELYGCIRNICINMRAKAGNKPFLEWRRGMVNSRTVVRVYD